MNGCTHPGGSARKVLAPSVYLVRFSLLSPLSQSLCYKNAPPHENEKAPRSMLAGLLGRSTVVRAQFPLSLRLFVARHRPFKQAHLQAILILEKIEKWQPVLRIAPAARHKVAAEASLNRPQNRSRSYCLEMCSLEIQYLFIKNHRPEKEAN